MLQTFHLSHLPPSLAVHVALFRDVRNASHLRQQLIDGNSEFEYAFIDANVVSKFEFLLDTRWLGHGAQTLMFSACLDHTCPSSCLSGCK